MTGFQYVDFKNVDITTTPKQIRGIYKVLEGNYRRALILHNGVVNGSERADCTAFATVSGTDFLLYYGNPAYHIKVTENDMVSLVAE